MRLNKIEQLNHYGRLENNDITLDLVNYLTNLESEIRT